MSIRDYTTKDRVVQKTGYKTVAVRELDCSDDGPDCDYAGQTNSPRDQPFTAAIYETIGYIRNELLETHAALTDIDSRIFGNGTEASDGDDRKEPYSVEARIMSALRDALSLARDNRFLTQELNARL
jgi:hypothetical protein